MHRHLQGLLLKAGYHQSEPPEAGGWPAFLDTCSHLFQAAEERNFLSHRMLRARTGEVHSLYQELLSQRDQLRFLLEEVPFGLACFDGRGQLQLHNSLALRGLENHTQLSSLGIDGQGSEHTGRLRLSSGLDQEYRWVALRRHGELRASCLIFAGSEPIRPPRIESDARLRPQLDAAQQQVKRYESAFGQLKQRLIHFSQELAQSQSDCESLRSERKESQRKIEELQAEIESLRTVTREMPGAEAHSLLLRELEQLQDAQKGSDDQQRVLREEFKQLQAQSQKAEQDGLKAQRLLRQELEQARQQLQQSQTEATESRRALASKEAHIEELQEALLNQEAHQWPAAPSPPATPARVLRVLLVEDEPISLLVTQECIESLGHQCVIAEDGNEALRWAGRQPVDVAITSYHMPGMNGVVLSRKLQQLQPDAPPFCILLTSMEKQEESLQAREAGMHILLKPLDPAELERVLSQVGDSETGA